MSQEKKKKPKPTSIRFGHHDMRRLNRMFLEKGWHRTEAVRRSLEFMERIMDADAVWVEIDGDRERMFF